MTTPNTTTPTMTKPTMTTCELLMEGQIKAAGLLHRHICKDVMNSVMDFVDWPTNAVVVAMRLHVGLPTGASERVIVDAFTSIFHQCTPPSNCRFSDLDDLNIFVPNKAPSDGRRRVILANATLQEMYDHVTNVTNGTRDNKGRPVLKNTGCMDRQWYCSDVDSWFPHSNQSWGRPEGARIGISKDFASTVDITINNTMTILMQEYPTHQDLQKELGIRSLRLDYSWQASQRRNLYRQFKTHSRRHAHQPQHHHFKTPCRRQAQSFVQNK